MESFLQLAAKMLRTPDLKGLCLCWKEHLFGLSLELFRL